VKPCSLQASSPPAATPPTEICWQYRARLYLYSPARYRS
jgi:hypothetical protein